MNEVILVTDMPDSCSKCKFLYEFQGKKRCQLLNWLYGTPRISQSVYTECRHDKCPLYPYQRKRDPPDWESSYDAGWNDCIDVIEKERRDTMKKLFISQPMNGKTDEEILKEREKAVESAKVILNDDVEVIESYFEDYNPDDGCIPLKYLSKALELLADADIAYFAKGWEQARGCKIENECAIAYGIDVIKDYSDAEETGMSFGTALEFLKNGCKIARKGWNGKEMFVVYQKGYPQGIPCNKQTAEAWGMDEGDLFKCNPYLQIKQVDGSHSMWVPSIGDVLAEDWVAVE